MLVKAVRGLATLTHHVVNSGVGRIAGAIGKHALHYARRGAEIGSRTYHSSPAIRSGLRAVGLLSAAAAAYHGGKALVSSQRLHPSDPRYKSLKKSGYIK